jgi:ABC-type transport system involved in multi-copper enzyme maturation permease subunit
MTVLTPYRSGLSQGRDGFAQLLHAELTKFRTVRGWLVGMVASVIVIAGLGLLFASTVQDSCMQSGGGPSRSGAACGLNFALGPTGEPVSDSFYFVHQPLTGNGSITVRMTSFAGLLPDVSGGLVHGNQSPKASAGPANGQNGPQGSPDTVPGLEEWAKAGIIVKASLTPGSAYAAMLLAGGHGARMQWNYTGDTAGMPGTAAAGNPRFLRLTRAGDVITGYDSADGANWAEVGTVTLAGLPGTVQVGLFATSPDDNQVTQNFGGGVSENGGGPTQVTGVFDQVRGGGWAVGPWQGRYIGASYASGVGGYHQAGGRLSVTGSGDIAPIAAGHGGPADPATGINDYLQGTFIALIVFAVIGALFITAEYRRGLIRVTFTASRGRVRVLAAKAIVIGAVSFITALAGAAIAVVVSAAVVHHRGYYEFPVPVASQVRVIFGTAVLAALVAVLALAIGAMVRRGAAAVAIVIVAIVVPYFLALTSTVPLSTGNWLLRITPAAGFALQQPYPVYHQVNMIYSALSGYLPLSGLGGFAVLCAWTLAAFAGASWLLLRRDA